MRKRRYEPNPNALKHGVFSSSAILPGEDPKEFTELLQSLVDEWQPSGALECETVMTLAECLRRKKRFGIFKKVERAKAIYGQLEDHFKSMSALEKQVDNSKDLKNDLANDVNLRWAIATQPVLEYLLRGTEVGKSVDKRVDYLWTSVFDALGVSEDKRIAWTIFSAQVAGLAALADVVTPDRFQKELNLQERLEGMIDRCIKRLGQLKAMKRMLGLDSQTKTLPSSEVDRLPPAKVRGMS